MCTYREWAVELLPWPLLLLLQGHVNTGAAAVIVKLQSTELGLCVQVLIHSWQHLSAWVACTAMSVSDHTLDVLLDHLWDLDLATILAGMVDWSEPYTQLAENYSEYGMKWTERVTGTTKYSCLGLRYILSTKDSDDFSDKSPKWVHLGNFIYWKLIQT